MPSGYALGKISYAVSLADSLGGIIQNSGRYILITLSAAFSTSFRWVAIRTVMVG
jgi:hypothetical protein